MSGAKPTNRPWGTNVSCYAQQRRWGLLPAVRSDGRPLRVECVVKDDATLLLPPTVSVPQLPPMQFTDERGPHGRSCVAKELSMVIPRVFLSAFMKRGNTKCWKSDQAPGDIWVNGFKGTEMTLTYKC